MTREDFVLKQRDYLTVFGGGGAPQRVLDDLAELCHFNTTTFATDPAELARNEGRRQVYLRIMTMLKFNPNEKEAP